MTVTPLYNQGISRYNNAFGNDYRQKNGYFSSSGYNDSFTVSQGYLKQRIAGKLSSQADEYLSHDKYAQAKNLYIRAINEKEDYAPAYHGLARVYKKEKNLPKAIETYEKLLKYHPDDTEGLTSKGNCHKDLGEYQKARQCFESAVEKDPKYDFAVRSLKQVDNLILARTNPILARKIREQQGEENLKEALKLAVSGVPEHYRNRLTDVVYTFDQTASLSGHQNIAQYEHSKRKITVKDDYRWAAPEIVAAYLVHENIHAGDKDAYTSVCEEQDAYEQSVLFWINNNNGVKDPELDYAAELYKQSPQTLRSKVGDIYRTRDKGISEYSPNHRPPNASTGLNIFGSLFSSISSVLGLNR